MQSEEMQTEIEKRIEEGASEYIKTCKDNMHSVSEAYCKADFKAGAKFILELPELREVVEFLKDLSHLNLTELQLIRNSLLESGDSYGNYDDCFTDGWDKADALTAIESRKLYETLKKAGLA